MSLSEKQKEGLNKLYEYRENIEHILAEIESVLMVDFEKHYHLSHQHWIPQIKTALRDDTKWLSRGDYSMDHTLKNIEDSIAGNCSGQGVSKYIK